MFVKVRKNRIDCHLQVAHSTIEYVVIVKASIVHQIDVVIVMYVMQKMQVLYQSWTQ